MAANRQSLCETVAALLPTYLPELQATYSYLRYTFGSQTPVAMVAAAGTRREKLTPAGGTVHHLADIHLFVLYASDADGVMEQDAYNLLATLEEGVGRMVNEQRRGACWKDLRYRQESSIGVDVIEGLAYLHEIVPVEALT